MLWFRAAECYYCRATPIRIRAHIYHPSAVNLHIHHPPLACKPLIHWHAQGQSSLLMGELLKTVFITFSCIRHLVVSIFGAQCLLIHCIFLLSIKQCGRDCEVLLPGFLQIKFESLWIFSFSFHPLWPYKFQKYWNYKLHNFLKLGSSFLSFGKMLIPFAMIHLPCDHLKLNIYQQILVYCRYTGVSVYGNCYVTRNCSTDMLKSVS